MQMHALPTTALPLATGQGDARRPSCAPGQLMMSADKQPTTTKHQQATELNH
jgi:hypothetical protein